MKKSVEKFLAAPETLKQSEAERRKYEQRKAQEVAREEQIKRLKSKDVPSTEDLLADLIRVADDEATNPWFKFRSLSRQRYVLYGHYPIAFVDREFGQFAHAKQVAGLEDKPGTRLKKAARTEASRREHAARYLKRYVLPFYRKDASLERENHGVKLILSISDTHATFLDPAVWLVFLSTIRDLKPDVVYLNGDILDGSEISRFPKVPGWTIPLQLEFDFAREMFAQIRKVYDGSLVWGGGNHGVDRIASYLTQVSPALANLRSMRFDKLCGLDDLGVTLAMGGTIASPQDQEDDKAGMLLYGTYRIHHGTYLGPTPAMSELRAAGRSGQSGHVHRAHVFYGTTERDAGMSWMSTPCGCAEIASRSYVKGITTGWQKGFGVCFIMPGGRVHQYPIVVDGGHAVVEGRHYDCSRVPDMDPTKLWLKDLKLS